MINKKFNSEEAKCICCGKTFLRRLRVNSNHGRSLRAVRPSHSLTCSKTCSRIISHPTWRSKNKILIEEGRIIRNEFRKPLNQPN